MSVTLAKTLSSRYNHFWSLRMLRWRYSNRKTTVFSGPGMVRKFNFLITNCYIISNVIWKQFWVNIIVSEAWNSEVTLPGHPLTPPKKCYFSDIRLVKKFKFVITNCYILNNITWSLYNVSISTWRYWTSTIFELFFYDEKANKKVDGYIMMSCVSPNITTTIPAVYYEEGGCYWSGLYYSLKLFKFWCN